MTSEKLMEMALAVRERHLRSLLDEARDVCERSRAARRSRSRRARLLCLARRHHLTACLKQLRPEGMTLQRYSGRTYVSYDPIVPRFYRQGLKEQMARLRRAWRDAKSAPLDPILGNLVTLVAETQPVPGQPMRVHWTLREVELEGVWIGDLEIELSLGAFDVHVTNLSIDVESRGGYPHPHVAADGSICWNSHDETARELHQSGDFLAVKDLIDNLLRNYNDNSPYISLADWDRDPGEPCDNCGDYYDMDDLHWSESGRCQMCEYCRAWCEHCGDYVRENQYDTELDACLTCVEDGTEVCAQCGETFWRNELTRTESQWFDCEHVAWLCAECIMLMANEEEEEEDKKEAIA